LEFGFKKQSIVFSLFPKAPNYFQNVENCRQLLFIFTFYAPKELKIDIVVFN